MGSYIKLAGEERMRPRSGDLIVFPPERRRAKNRVRISGRMLREKYGITFSDHTQSYHATSAVSERHLVDGLFHGRPELPFCVVVNRVLATGARHLATRPNSFDAPAAFYPADAFAVTGYHVPCSPGVHSATDIGDVFATIMAAANLGQSDMDARVPKPPRSSLAEGLGNESSPTHDDDVEKLFAGLGRDGLVAGLDWLEKLSQTVCAAAGRARLGDLLHSAAARWLDQTTRFPSLRQFAVPLRLLKDESVRVYRLAGSDLADAVLDAALADMTDQMAGSLEHIDALISVLESAKGRLSAYGRKVDGARKPTSTIRQAVDALADDISAVAAATMPEPPRTDGETTSAQNAADALRAVARERRLA